MDLRSSFEDLWHALCGDAGKARGAPSSSSAGSSHQVPVTVAPVDGVGSKRLHSAMGGSEEDDCPGNKHARVEMPQVLQSGVSALCDVELQMRLSTDFITCLK